MIDIFRGSAKLIIDQLRPLSDIDFGYNCESAAWLEGYIERIKDAGIFDSELQRSHLIDGFGSFLGECIIHCYGGFWTQHDGKWCVAFNQQSFVYPFTEVEKQIDNGLVDGINSFFEVIPAKFAGYVKA